VRGEEREGREERGDGKEERSPSQIRKVKRWQPYDIGGWSNG